MKKLALVGGLLGAACLLGMGTCNLFRDPTSPPSDWFTLEPDSVKGDTTFYSLAIKAETYQHRWGERTRFAVYQGYWYFYKMCWVPDQTQPYGERLEALSAFYNEFSLSVRASEDSAADAADYARAVKVIQEAGGSITRYALYGGYHGFLVRMKAAPHGGRLNADMNPLEFLMLFYEHLDLFAGAYPHWPCWWG